ncbi:MAG TPA: hypothetical protein VFE33_16885 [Thermoanaerobaculia bacterium]|nr:hypothetical protein [Thermoanaerobaculia bacterium]
MAGVSGLQPASENLVGCRMKDADRILPELQRVRLQLLFRLLLAD